MADKKKSKKKKSPTAQDVADKYSGQARDAWNAPTTPEEIVAQNRGQLQDAWGGGVDLGQYGPGPAQVDMYSPQLGDPRVDYASAPGGPSGEQLRQALAILMQQIGRR